jgi:hypothetical protein
MKQSWIVLIVVLAFGFNLVPQLGVGVAFLPFEGEKETKTEEVEESIGAFSHANNLKLLSCYVFTNKYFSNHIGKFVYLLPRPVSEPNQAVNFLKTSLNHSPPFFG